MENEPKTQYPGQQDRGWRVTTYTAVRAGHILTVETFWCAETANEWRWYVVPANVKGFSCPVEWPQPSLEEAQRAAEAWIDARIAAAHNLAVYAFAGLEPKAETPAYRYGPGAPCMDEIEREHEKAADDYALGASDHAFEAAGDR